MFHSLQVAWLRTEHFSSYEFKLIKEGFLVAADGERVVGSAQHPAMLGMRVRFLDRLRFLEPVIHADSGGGPGTISWISPWDPEDPGKSGGVCQVIWDWTGVRDCYRTGYKGEFCLRLLDEIAMRNHQEIVLGSTLQAQEGQRVRISSAARRLMPSLCRGCEPIWGCGTVTRVLDLETSPLSRHLMLRNSEAERQRKQAENKTANRLPETLVGIDIKAEVGMRVMLSRDARKKLLVSHERLHSGSDGGGASPASDSRPHTSATQQSSSSHLYFCAGTIVLVGKAVLPGQDPPLCPIGTVSVLWDNGCEGGHEQAPTDVESDEKTHLCNVGRDGVFDLIVVRDQVLLGCNACPLALGLRVVLCRRMVDLDSASLLESGDGPGEVQQIIGWQRPLDSPVAASAEREIVTADTEMASESADGEDEMSARGASSTKSSDTRGHTSGKSEGSGGKGKGAVDAVESQEAEEPTGPPVAGEVVVKWEKTGKEVRYKCGVDGEFCLAVWTAGDSWQGHMCEVKWDVTDAVSTFAYEYGYEYKYSVGGLKTRQVDGGQINRIQPLVLSEEKPDVQGIVTGLIDHACELVEHELKTQQKAATLMQKLARGVWGRRRIRRLRVVASSREVLRMHASGAQFDLSQLLKRRQAFPPFSLQWRLLVLLHRMQEAVSASSKLEMACVPPETLSTAAGPVAPAVVREMRACADLLAEDDLHAKEKAEAIVTLTALMTHKELTEQRRLQDAAVAQGIIPHLLEAVMGVVASEPPEDDEAKQKGAWAAEMLGNGAGNQVNISKEMEQAVEQLQHAASLALAQLALSNRRACHALMAAGGVQVIGLLLEKGTTLQEYFAEALVGVMNNLCVGCPLAPALARETCQGFLHDLVALLLPPRDDDTLQEEEAEEFDDDASREARMTHMGIPALSQGDIVNLMRVADVPFRLPRTCKSAEQLARGERQPLSSLQAVALMALSAIACRDASCRGLLSSCGLVRVLEFVLPHLAKLERYGPPRAYAAVRWSKDHRLPEDAMAVYLYLCVRPSPPHPNSLAPPPALGSAHEKDLALVVLNAASDWLSFIAGEGGASLVDTPSKDSSLVKRAPSQVSRMPSVDRTASISSGKGWDTIRRVGSLARVKSVERVASGEGKLAAGWTTGCMTQLALRGPLPDSRAHPPISILTCHAIIAEREKARKGFGRTASGGSQGAISRAGSGGSGISRMPSFGRVPSGGSKFGRVPSIGRARSGASVEVEDEEAAAALEALHAQKTKAGDRPANGIVGLTSVPVPMHLAMSILRLCATGEGRQALKEAQGYQVISKLVCSPHVGPCARRLLMQALLLLTYNVTARSPVAPMVAARELGKGPRQRGLMSDEEIEDEMLRAEVLEAVMDLELMQTLKQDKTLLTQLSSIADDTAHMNHAAILAKAAAPPQDPSKERDVPRSALEDVVSRTDSGEALEILDEEAEPRAKARVGAAAVLEEIHGGGDDMMAGLERGWESDTLAATLVWQISNFSESAQAAGGCLDYLVRDSGHVIIACPSEGAEDEQTLAQELARQHLVVWGQGDEKMTGLNKQDRPVDSSNNLIPLPTWLSLGIGACSAVLVLWSPRFEEDVRCVAQVAYARCLGKTILLIERCSFGLWNEKLGESTSEGAGRPSAALDLPRSPSEASENSSNDELSELPELQAPPENLEIAADVQPHIDDHLGRYSVVGKLHLQRLSESEQTPEALIAIASQASSVLWASVNLGCYVKKPIKRLKQVIPDHTTYWMHPALRQLALREFALREAAKQKTSAGPDSDDEAAPKGTSASAEDDKDKGPKKRMAVDYNEVAAAEEAAEAARLMARHEVCRLVCVCVCVYVYVCVCVCMCMCLRGIPPMVILRCRSMAALHDKCMSGLNSQACIF